MTATDACSGSLPVANALGAGSLTTYTCGLGIPAASAMARRGYAVVRTDWIGRGGRAWPQARSCRSWRSETRQRHGDARAQRPRRRARRRRQIDTVRATTATAGETSAEQHPCPATVVGAQLLEIEALAHTMQVTVPCRIDLVNGDGVPGVAAGSAWAGSGLAHRRG